MGDWSPLADADPVPGNPDAVTALAVTLDELSMELRLHAGAADGIDPTEVWEGLAADVFAGHQRRIPPMLRRVAGRHQRGAAALRRYAPELAAAQSTARQALELARAAEEARAAAEAGLDAIHHYEADASRAAVQWNRDHPADPSRSPEPWSGPDWASQLGDAESDLQAARALLAEAVSARDLAAGACAAALREAADDHLTDTGGLVGFFQTILSWTLVHRPPPTFVQTPDGLVLNTRESWRREALEAAGIDPERWDPQRGLGANDDIVRAVYAYYGDLYLDDPRFQWAGMAHIVGGTFYGGWQDIYVARHITDAGARAEALSAWLDLPFLPAAVVDYVASKVLDLGTDELEYYETTMLAMQREIFEDMGWMHEAYRQGGMTAIRSLAAAGELPPGMLEAWENIGSGDPARVAQGNEALLLREQSVVIQNEYDAIHSHSPSGSAFTLGLSALGFSPIEGGEHFWRVVAPSVDVGVDIVDPFGWIPPGPQVVPRVDVDVPNVADFDDRWAWISDDMLPAYQQLLAEHPERADELMRTPVADLAEDHRLIPLDYVP